MQRGDESYTRVVEALTTLQHADSETLHLATKLIDCLKGCDSFTNQWFEVHVLLPALALFYENKNNSALVSDAYTILISLYIRLTWLQEFEALLCGSISDIKHSAMPVHGLQRKLRYEANMVLRDRFKEYFIVSML